MATARPRRVSTARKTSPMPPAPSLLSMQYGPRRAPAVNCGTPVSSCRNRSEFMEIEMTSSLSIQLARQPGVGRRNYPLHHNSFGITAVHVEVPVSVGTERDEPDHDAILYSR